MLTDTTMETLEAIQAGLSASESFYMPADGESYGCRGGCVGDCEGDCDGSCDGDCAGSCEGDCAWGCSDGCTSSGF